MRGVLKWIDKVANSNQKQYNQQEGIRSLGYSPDGKVLVIAAGEKLLFYDSANGTLLHALKAHKGLVNCVAYSRDGRRLASGGADKTVIIWSTKLEALLKYTHNDSIQCLCFNPTSHQLVSCSTSDFAYWSPEQKGVPKHKIQARVNSCAWTSDGQYLVLGLANGTVSVRDKSGEQQSCIKRSEVQNNVVNSVQCCPLDSVANLDTIAVVDSNQTLSFYTLAAKIIGRERSLGFDPLCVQYFPNGEFCVVCGCTSNLHLFTRDGIRLGILCEGFDTWILTVAFHPNGQSLTVGCQNGTIACFTLTTNMVHALYHEKYAFRENMCDVIIQHLTSDQKVRIKCRDIIHKIAIYRNYLAVQLPERVVLYEMSSDHSELMHYKVKEKIQKRFNCNLLVVCGAHIVFCQEKRLQCLDFAGNLQREWIMDSFIRYIKVMGGVVGRESLMIGLNNGQIYRVFMDNSLAVLITSAVSAVCCLDVNSNRTKVAVVDDDGRLTAYDFVNDILLYQDTGVSAVAWNIHSDSMLCYTYKNGGLNIRVGNLPPRAPQNLNGVVVGLSGSTAFCLIGNVMQSTPLALGAAMWQFIDAGLFEEAYQVACLGVTESDWQGLAQTALDSLHINIARNAYVKVRNLPWLQLIAELRDKQQHSTVPKEVLQAEACAYAGQFKKAARYFQKCNQSGRALEMYTDLRLFDAAQEFLRKGDEKQKREIISKRAEWANAVREPRIAVELLLSVGNYRRAIDIVTEQGWADVLHDIGRRINKRDKDSLRTVAKNLKKLRALDLASDIFKKLGDDTEVVQMHIDAREWDAAFLLAADNPEVLSKVHFENAKWLADNDQFVEAHEAYMRAGKLDEANQLLKQLSECALEEERFIDASYYYWLRAKQSLTDQNADNVSNSTSQQDYKYNLSFAKIYYAYNAIYSYVKEPYTSNSPVSLFNISRFILNEVDERDLPRCVSMFSVLFTLARQCKILNANKLCLTVTKRLQTLKPPAGMQEQIDMDYLNSKACRSFNDPEELLPLCYKCSNYSQHMNGNTCPICGEDYIFSFVSFEILPLVQFYHEADISDAEAESLLRESVTENDVNDPFSDEAASALTLTFDRAALRAINIEHVIIMKRRNMHSRYNFYRNLMPTLRITHCPECFLLFCADDFEAHVMLQGHCPFCRFQIGDFIENKEM